MSIRIGDKFGELVVIKTDNVPKHILPSGRKVKKVKCKCVCGKRLYIFASNLKRRKSCGCLMKKNVQIDKKYGRLKIIKEIPTLAGKKRKVCCICDCGKKVIIQLGNLVSGHSKSCGCLRRELTKKYNKKHGMTGTREHQTWCHIIQRCFDKKIPQYKNYGGRCIKVCDRWLGKNGFENFYKDMGDRPSPNHSIDRIDNDGDYAPENCRWATMKEQQNNRNNNIFVSMNGVKISMNDLADFFNVDYETIRRRIISNNWDIKRAIFTSTDEYHKKDDYHKKT